MHVKIAFQHIFIFFLSIQRQRERQRESERVREILRGTRIACLPCAVFMPIVLLLLFFVLILFRFLYYVNSVCNVHGGSGGGGTLCGQYCIFVLALNTKFILLFAK